MFLTDADSFRTNFLCFSFLRIKQKGLTGTKQFYMKKDTTHLFSTVLCGNQYMAKIAQNRISIEVFKRSDQVYRHNLYRGGKRKL